MNEDKATRYHRLKRRSGAASLAAGVSALAVFWLSGASAWLRDVVVRAVHAAGVPPAFEAVAVVAGYVAVVCVTAEVGGVPVGGVSRFRVGTAIRPDATDVSALVCRPRQGVGARERDGRPGRRSRPTPPLARFPGGGGSSRRRRSRVRAS